jgi:Leucine-rich repeat (LRR) protein
VQPVLDAVFNEFAVGFGVPILIGLGTWLTSDEFKEYKAARCFFWISAIWTYGKVLMWSGSSSYGFWTRAAIVFFVCGIIGVALTEALRLTTKRERSETGTAMPPMSATSGASGTASPQDHTSRSLFGSKAEGPPQGDTHATSPLGALAELGWGVKDGKDATTFEISARELPRMEESARYFRMLRKPFQLNLQQVSSIQGLHFLAGIDGLSRIEIGASNINSLAELQELSGLRQLVVSQTPFTAVTEDLNIEAVSSLVSLETLSFNMSRVRSIEPLRHLKKLATLSVGGTLVDDLSPVERLRSLKSVDVRDSGVTDLSPLQGASRLEELSIDAKQALSLINAPQIKKLTIIAQVPVQMAAVESLTNLTSLFIWGPPVIDFTPLRKLDKLASLQASGLMMNQRSAVVGLDSIRESKLTALTIGSLQIGSLGFLDGNSTITDLNLSSIPITNGAELATMSSLRKLSLVDVPLVDISPLLSLPTLKELSLLRTPARADVIAALQRRGVKVTSN